MTGALPPVREAPPGPEARDGATDGAASAGPTATATGPTLRSSVRRGRGPVLVLAVVALAGLVVGLLSAVPVGGYLDPDSFAPSGSRAVVELLRDGGVDVARVGTVEEALERDGERSLLVVPRPEGLARQELERLAAREGPLLVVEPSDDDLADLGLPAEVDGTAPLEGRRPQCEVEAARRAGDVELGGTLYRPTGDAAGTALACYPFAGVASLLLLPDRDAVVLGGGALLTNDALDERGNAALALALLGGSDRVSWLVPAPGRDVPAGEQRPLGELVPDALVLGALQVAVAVAVLALWRARRLGRVVEEPLPVVVRAAEAVEGRGRLYRAAGARDAAADALRTGARDRITARLGLPPGTAPPAVVATAAARTGRADGAIGSLLYGAPPSDDAALVRLADALRALERAVTEPPSGADGGARPGDRPEARPDARPDRSPEVAGP